jgi:hypothetical protein
MTDKMASKIVPIDVMTSSVEKKLKQSNLWGDLESSLSQCTSDTERMKVVLGSETVLDEIERQIRTFKKSGKSQETANLLRTAGNECFRLTKYHKALEYYTQAVCHAPWPGSGDGDASNILALSFGNRFALILFPFLSTFLRLFYGQFLSLFYFFNVVGKVGTPKVKTSLNLKIL